MPQKTFTPLHDAIRRVMGFRQQTDNMPWSDKSVTRLSLADAFRDLGFTSGVEVGTQRGLYARELCQRNPNLHLTCVDPWKEYHGISQEHQDAIYEQAQENLRGLPVAFLRLPSLEAVESFSDGSLDFVYIDGDHTFDAVMQDIIRWSQKVKKGGIVACHDFYHFKWAGVVAAVEAYVRAHDIRPWYVTREVEPTVFWVRP